MRKALNIIGACMAGVICMAIVGCYQVTSHISKELTRYKLATKIEALTEIDQPGRLKKERPVKSVPVPNINLSTIEYDQYDDILEELQKDKDTAKADAQSALANFIATAKTNRFVTKQYTQIADADIDIDNLDDLLCYVDREKALALSQNNLFALQRQTKRLAEASQETYWQMLDNYIQVTFHANDIEDEVNQKIAEHEAQEREKEEQRRRAAEEAAKLATEQTWAGVPAGAAGLLRIPQYSISIPLYASQSQSTVDAANSAAYFSFNGVMVIGDHWNQNGFSAVRNMAVGTRVYIDNPDGSTSSYTVTWSGSGTNTASQLLFPDGSVVDGRYGGLVLYTCRSNWQDVALVCCG